MEPKQTSGAFGGAFAMGMIAGLVASPCTSAPLSGALLYVAQSGDLFTGAVTPLFARTWYGRAANVNHIVW